MHLVKGRSVPEESEERCFRYPAHEEIAEVSCGDDEGDQPAVFARSESAGRPLRDRRLDRRGDLEFAYQS
jgi:hypothetical protein